MAFSLPFQQQFTWRKLGYLFYQDSLSYREVLEQNPQWTVVKLPPVGAELRIDSTGGAPGSLVQGNFIFGLPTGSEEDQIFPFNTQAEYDAALDRYTLQGVVERTSINGVTADSQQAFTGQQYG